MYTVRRQNLCGSTDEERSNATTSAREGVDQGRIGSPGQGFLPNGAKSRRRRKHFRGFRRENSSGAGCASRGPFRGQGRELRSQHVACFANDCLYTPPATQRGRGGPWET